MPIDETIDEGARVVISTVRGSLQLDDITDYFERVWSKERYAGYSELFDLRDTTSPELSLPGLRSVAGAAHALIGADDSVKLAMVPAPGGLKAAKAYKTFREMRSETHSEIRIFEDVNEARRWLGLDEES